MRNAIRTEGVAGITEWVAVFLGWISGAVSTANMTATLTLLVGADEKCLAFVACSPNTLARLFVVKVLAVDFCGLLEHSSSAFTEAVIGDEGRIFFSRLHDRYSSLTVAEFFGLRALRRISWTLDAAQMLTVGTFLGAGQGRETFMASPSDANPDRLIHTEHRVIDCGPDPV